MKQILLLVLFLVAVSVQWSLGQQQSRSERINIHVGIEFSVLFQSDMWQDFDQIVMDTTGNYTFETDPRGSFRFGGYLRWDIYGIHSLETGLYQTSRKYKSEVFLSSTGELLGSNTIKGVAYEVPLVWAVSVQLAEDSRLSTGFGGVMSYFISDFGVFDFEYNLDGFRRSRFLPGIKANVGFEQGMGDWGGFYLGATFQHHFQSIAFLRMEYFEDGTRPRVGQVELSGSYFAAVLRYMFPMK